MTDVERLNSNTLSYLENVMVFAKISVDLELSTCWCGTPHAVPAELLRKQERDLNNGRDQEAIYCPLGHRYIKSGEGEAAKLRKWLEEREREVIRERQRHDQTRVELEATERKRRALKGNITKLKRRAAAGVCPCCTRTFQNLARHMETKHPEFATDEKLEAKNENV